MGSKATCIEQQGFLLQAGCLAAGHGRLHMSSGVPSSHVMLQVWVTECSEELVSLWGQLVTLLNALFVSEVRGLKCKICFDKLPGFQNIGFEHCW